MEQLPSHEVVGTRVGHLPIHHMVELWAAATSGIVEYRFAIESRDLDPPRTGIFDGLRIVIDPDVGFEMQCSLLLHLFGHSAQWVAPAIKHKLEATAAHGGPCAVHAGAARLRVRGGRVWPAAAARARRGPARSVVQRFRPHRLALRRALLPNRRLHPGTHAWSAAARLSNLPRFRR